MAKAIVGTFYSEPEAIYYQAENTRDSVVG
jgi:hypothetical protein